MIEERVRRTASPVLAVLALAAGCEDSPVGPSDTKGLTLTNMSMTWLQMQGSLGSPPFTTPPPLHTIYSLCGNVRPSPGASEQIVIQKWEYTILNADGSVLLTWVDPLFAGDMVGLGLSGCFGGPIDEVPNRPAGSNYRVRVTYSGGGKGAVEASGPISRH